jgi:hypothetical protein
MTSKEIEELAGHRPVPAWVVKLVGDAVAAEREACARVAESYEPECDTCPSGVSNAIQARGKDE